MMLRLSPILLLLALVLTAAPALAQPSVTVNGPSSATVVDICDNLTWTCSASGGVPPYNWYEWRVDGSVVTQGTSVTSYTRQYCTTEGAPPMVVNDTISCTVTDANGRTGTGSKNVTVTFP